jgi:hypothetical protein
MNHKEPMPGAKFVGVKASDGKTQPVPGAKTVRKEPLAGKRPTADKKPLANKKPPPLPTPDELQHKMLHLIGAVAMGRISIKEANLMLKILKIALDAQLKRSSSETPVRDEAALTDACRRDPALINAIAPLLTDEQLANLMQETSDAHAEQDDGGE